MQHIEYIKLNAIVVGIHLLLHDRAGTLASLLYKSEKLSVCPYVRLSVTSVSWNFCMDQHRSANLLGTRSLFLKVLHASVCHL